MERPISIQQIGSGALEVGRIGYHDAVERLSQMLEEAKLRVANTISYVLHHPYNTPDGKPLEIHWYTEAEIAELNQRGEINQALDQFQKTVDQKLNNGDISRQYKALSED